MVVPGLASSGNRGHRILLGGFDRVSLFMS